MNWKLILFLGFACAALALAGLVYRLPADDGYELTILHTNDVHAHYDSFVPWGELLQGGAARLKTLVDEIRDEEDDVLFLDAGDQFQGTLFFTVGGAEVVADVMNDLGYDAMCVGNHEFDAGPAVLADFIDAAGFPVLSANIDASADPDLSGRVYPYAVYDFDDASVGVFGLTTESTEYASSPGPSVRFLEVAAAARNTIAELTADGIDIIIALTHQGLAHDMAMANSVGGIDIVVGGHSHTLLGLGESAEGPYPVVTMSASGEPVLIVTAAEWGKYLGRLDVSFTSDGLVSGFAGEPIFIDASIPEDERVVAILDRYRPAIDALMTQVVGETTVDLNGAREEVRVAETNLGNLICDAILWKTSGLGATIAIQNGGGIRASIPPGEITMGQVLEVLPYGNQITTVTITGGELLAAIENGVSGVEEEAGSFPHVGGMRFSFDLGAEPGDRVEAVEVWDDGTESYVPLDPGAVYTIATNNYLADGGDGYDYSGASERYDSGWLLSDAFAEYLESVGPVAPDIEGRITQKSE